MTLEEINQGRLEIYFKAHRLVFSHYIRWGRIPAAAAKTMEETSSMQAFLDVLSKFNPYHVPAGSPEGGQFDFGPGGGGTSEGTSDSENAKPLLAQFEEEEPREELNDPVARARVTDYETARDTLRQLDPNHRYLESLHAPGSIPSRAAIDQLNEEIVRMHNERGAEAEVPYALGGFKGSQTWVNQLSDRGWTDGEIADTLAKGERYPAPNYVNRSNTATRFENTQTGKYIVRDNVTGEILQLGDKNFDRPAIP